MNHQMTLTTNELLVIREALHSITLKGVDAVLVGGLLQKVYAGIDAAVNELEINQSDIKDGVNGENKVGNTGGNKQINKKINKK